MIVDNSKSIWEHRYRPSNVQDLVIPDDMKTKFKEYIKTQDLPNLGLFSSFPGTGKSSTANAILKELNCEALWINGSIENGIDVLRGRLQKFVSQSSFDGNIKVVVIDESDNLSQDNQKAFRGFLDEYSQNCRFIFTGNFKEKMLEPLLSRLEVYDFNSFNKKDMIKPIFERLKFILENEGVQFDPKQLVPIINTFYPRVRSMVLTLQKFTKDGKFEVHESELDDLDAFDKIMKFVSFKTYTEMVSEVNRINAPDNMFTFLYNNASKYFAAENYPGVVLTIAKYQHMSSSVRDKNLNLAACLTELIKIKEMR